MEDERDYMDEKHLKEYRMPRILIVVNDIVDQNGRMHHFSTPEELTMALDCTCMKYTVKGENCMHAVVPVDYSQGEQQTIIDVCKQAADKGKPYDIIIADTVFAGKAIKEMADNIDPKPGVMLFLHRHNQYEVPKLRQIGFPVFTSSDAMNTAIVEQQFELAMGKDGIARLKCKTGELSSYDETFGRGSAAGAEHGFLIVEPQGAAHSEVAVRYALLAER